MESALRMERGEPHHKDFRISHEEAITFQSFPQTIGILWKRQHLGLEIRVGSGHLEMGESQLNGCSMYANKRDKEYH